MNDQDFADLINHASEYAKDPTTDRNFLASRFIEAHIKGNGIHRSECAELVEAAFHIADEFILNAKSEKPNE